MAVNLSVKNVPDDLAELLRRRAAANHRSLQRELVSILEAAVGRSVSPGPAAVRTPAREALTIEQVAELAAEHKNLEAIKESSGDARRITALKNLLGDRLTILVGMDDCIVEIGRAHV